MNTLENTVRTFSSAVSFALHHSMDGIIYGFYGILNSILGLSDSSNPHLLTSIIILLPGLITIVCIVSMIIIYFKKNKYAFQGLRMLLLLPLIWIVELLCSALYFTPRCLPNAYGTINVGGNNGLVAFILCMQVTMLAMMIFFVWRLKGMRWFAAASGWVNFYILSLVSAGLFMVLSPAMTISC